MALQRMMTPELIASSCPKNTSVSSTGNGRAINRGARSGAREISPHPALTASR
jgi:hypothetical protein